MTKRKCLLTVAGIISCAGMILLLFFFCGGFASESASDAETGIFQPSASDFFFEHAKEKELTPHEWQSAAENGNVWAQCRVGDYYASGSGGFSHDPCEALNWWYKAADQGNTAAKFRLAKYFWLKSFMCWCEEHHFL